MTSFCMRLIMYDDDDGLVEWLAFLLELCGRPYIMQRAYPLFLFMLLFVL